MLSCLVWVEDAHNALISSATGFSQFHCVYGYQPPMFPPLKADVCGSFLHPKGHQPDGSEAPAPEFHASPSHIPYLQSESPLVTAHPHRCNSLMVVHRAQVPDALIVVEGDSSYWCNGIDTAQRIGPGFLLITSWIPS